MDWQYKTIVALRSLYKLLSYDPDIMLAANRDGIITDNELTALGRWYSRILESKGE